MLQKAYLLAKIGADTAENERTFAEHLPNGFPRTRGSSRTRCSNLKIVPDKVVLLNAPSATVGGAELMTGGGWCMYTSANFLSLVLGFMNADLSTKYLFSTFFEIYKI